MSEVGFLLLMVCIVAFGNGDAGLRVAYLAVCFAGVALYWVWNVAPSNFRYRSPLEQQTGSWTKAVLVRSYPNDKSGVKLAEVEANILHAHGYEITGQSAFGSHVNVGETVAGAVLTGGLSLLFGGSVKKGAVQISFVKRR